MFMSALCFLFLGCTTQGELDYITKTGERKTICQVEYIGAPSVDKYAVEYALSYCAKKVAQQGHTVLEHDLLTLDLSIPTPPVGQTWTFELATKQYKNKALTDKEYGYIVAYVDLGLGSSTK